MKTIGKKMRLLIAGAERISFAALPIINPSGTNAQTPKVRTTATRQTAGPKSTPNTNLARNPCMSSEAATVTNERTALPITTMVAVAGVTHIRRKMPCSRSVTSEYATPKKAPENAVMVNNPGIRAFIPSGILRKMRANINSHTCGKRRVQISAERDRIVFSK